MKLPQLKRSCCGCNLRTASICVAYIYFLAISIFASVAVFFAVVLGSYHTAIALDVCLITQFIATVLLLIGIYRKRKAFISAWIICSTIMLVAMFIDVFDLLFLLVFYFAWPLLVWCLAVFLMMAAKTYMILLVHNYKKEMSENYGKYENSSIDIPLA